MKCIQTDSVIVEIVMNDENISCLELCSVLSLLCTDCLLPLCTVMYRCKMLLSVHNVYNAALYVNCDDSY